jgi:hypothetical protein
MNYLKYIAMAAIAVFTMASCEITDDNDSEKDSLYVKFMNEQASQYTITTLQIRNRGSVDAQLEPTEPWGENILKNGQRIAPGEHIYFNLDLPNGHWAEYRLGVDNGNGVEVMLYDQPNYDGFTNLPITHWGSDKRTVSVTITYNNSNQTITVSGWSDWAGIDE